MRKRTGPKNFFLVAATGEIVAKTSVDELAARKYAIRSERTRQGMWELTNLLYSVICAVQILSVFWW